MTLRKIILIAAWAVSLAVAHQMGARAQADRIDVTGADLRFIQTDTVGGVPVGVLGAKVDGKWIKVKLQDETIKGIPKLQPLK